MNVVTQSMPFDEFNTVLSAKVSKDPTDVLSQLAEYGTFAVFRYEDDVISTVPSYMRLALPFSHLDPLSL